MPFKNLRLKLVHSAGKGTSYQVPSPLVDPLVTVGSRLCMHAGWRLQS